MNNSIQLDPEQSLRASFHLWRTNQSRTADAESYISKLWAMLLTICATCLLLACSADKPPVTATNEPPASPTSTPLALSNGESSGALPNPPVAILSNGTAQSEAALGSYCWHFEQTSTIDCANVFHLSAPTEPLVVLAGQKLTIQLPDQPVMLVTMRVLEWQISDGAVTEGDVAIALDAPVVASGDLEPQSTIEWEAPPMAGEYMLDLMSVYENEGHIGYGWHILVE